jgi:two-component system, cell cycle sensor histidine kinase and response regulator CckA
MTERSPQSFALWAGIGAAAVGAVVLLGWALDVPVIIRLRPSWPSMKPNTALSLILCGMSLALVARTPVARSRRIVSRVLAAVVGLMATATLSSYLFSVNVGVDQILRRERPSELDSPAPGRMAPATAVTFSLLALALLTIDAETKRGRRPAQLVAALGGPIALAAVLGYVYDAHPMLSQPFASVALHTASAVAALWLGILQARPLSGFMGEFTAATPGGRLARRLLPTASLAVILLGLLGVVGERAGNYRWEFGLALFATANVTAFALLVWHGTRWLNRADAERTRAENDLAKSEWRYRRFFEQHLTGTCTTGLRPTIVECNPAFARIFGFDSVQEAIGTSIAPLYAEAAERDMLVSRLRQERQITNMEMDMRTRGGRLIQVRQDILGEFDDSGQLCGITRYIQDITELRQIQQRLERAGKMEAVGQLAGGIAHDFNNLLGVMMGFSDLLAREIGPSHTAARRVKAIREAVDRAAALTRQLLIFSRNQPVETKICDLNGILAGMEDMLNRLIGENVQLVVATKPALPGVRADPRQLEQVIVNLAVNARDAIPEGGKIIIETADVSLDVNYARTHPEAVPGPHVALTVTDTGGGMDPETASRIFEPFFTTKGPGKGTGLGLATVYGIVKRFGGHVTVYSELGRGAAFTIYFPVVGGPAEDTSPQVGAAGGPALGGTETVLVLEDEDSLREIIAEVLRSAGYEVLQASDADSAVAAATERHEPIHLLLTDVVLRTRSGPRTASDLRARFPGLRVLFMSGYTDRAVENHEALDSVHHFLQKPFSTDELLRAVRAVLDGG